MVIQTKPVKSVAAMVYGQEVLVTNAQIQLVEIMEHQLIIVRNVNAILTGFPIKDTVTNVT